MSIERTRERRLTAFLPEDTFVPERNPIHDDAGAREQGFEAALVPAPNIVGWTVPAIREALGDRWLHDGWADLRFRRPVYAGREIGVQLTADAAGAWRLSVRDDSAEECARGRAGLGRAPWYAHLQRPATIEVQPPRRPRLPLRPQAFPLGRDLPAAALPITPSEASAYVDAQLADTDPIWHGPGARLHPGWLARRGTETLRHTYGYGSSIQTQLHLQHLAPAHPGALTCGGRVVDGYERNGHHYAVLDIVLQDASGHDLMQLRYTVIYMLAPRSSAQAGA